MTFAVIPLALVKTYRSTGVPSAVLPNSIFWTPASILPPPFACGSAAAPDENPIPKTQTSAPASTEDVCIDQLLVAWLTPKPVTVNLARTARLIHHHPRNRFFSEFRARPPSK